MDEMDVFFDMLDDDAVREKDFFDKFIEICSGYGEHSLEPYVLFCRMFEEEIPMEPYYLEALMHVYMMHTVDDTFLDMLEAVLETGYCKKYIEDTHKILAEYVEDGWITVYRGEFATSTISNLDYTTSVSYTVDYEMAKHFATRFKGIMNLTKSVIYTMKVPLEDVVAYNYREEEVVCIPRSRGGKMRMIKEESML